MAKKTVQESAPAQVAARRGRPRKAVQAESPAQPTQAEELPQKAQARKKGTVVREM